MNSKPIEPVARRINMQDYDNACSIVTWCGGRALGEDRNPYVIEVPGPNGPEYAQDGDWIKQTLGGGFHVTVVEHEETA